MQIRRLISTVVFSAVLLAGFHGSSCAGREPAAQRKVGILLVAFGSSASAAQAAFDHIGRRVNARHPSIEVNFPEHHREVGSSWSNTRDYIFSSITITITRTRTRTIFASAKLMATATCPHMAGFDEPCSVRIADQQHGLDLFRRIAQEGGFGSWKPNAAGSAK